MTSEQEGLLWRIEPGPRPSERTIDVGVGRRPTSPSARARSGRRNYVDGTVSRIDPRTNAVTTDRRRRRAGARRRRRLGVGQHRGRRRATGTLPASACAEVDSAAPRAGRPDRLRPPAPGRRRRRARARWPTRSASCCAQHDYRAGGSRSATGPATTRRAQTGDFENRRCAANANAFARAERLVARDRPVQLVLRRRSRSRSSTAPPGGPLAHDQPVEHVPGPYPRRAGCRRRAAAAASRTSTTRPGVAQLRPPGRPRRPAGRRPCRAREAAGAAAASTCSTTATASEESWRRPVPQRGRAARRRDRRARRRSTRRPRATRRSPTRSRARAPRASCSAATRSDGGDRVVKALRARLGTPRHDHGQLPVRVRPRRPRTGRAVRARGLYATTLDLPLDRAPADAGRPGVRARPRRIRRLRAQACCEAGQAAELVLAAIARSDGTRASVLRELRASEVKDGILGTFSFDRQRRHHAGRDPDPAHHRFDAAGRRGSRPSSRERRSIASWRCRRTS